MKIEGIMARAVSCERDSFAKGIFPLLQMRKTALLGWRVTEIPIK
jgi:hypothetical protein